MYRYLTQVQQEIFKQGIHRNIVGTLTSFPIYYFVDSSLSVLVLAAVGIVQAHSIYKHKKCTQILGYTKEQKHLLKGDYSFVQNDINNINNNSSSEQSQSSQQFDNTNSFSFNDNSNNVKEESKINQTNYQKYLQNSGVDHTMNSSFNNNKNNSDSSYNLNSQQNSSQAIQYIQVENTEERMKYYNRQLFCMGLLQGLFLGNYHQIWEDGYILSIQLGLFANTFLNGKVFEHFYSTNYNMTHFKAMMIGTFTPLPFLIIAPAVFNNGFLQSNILKKAQNLFLSDNINQDPSLFLLQRTGMRFFGLLLLYLFTFTTMLKDVDEGEEDEDDEDKNILGNFNYVILKIGNSDKDKIKQKKKDNVKEISSSETNNNNDKNN